VAEADGFNQTMHLTSKLHPQIVVMELHMDDKKVATPSQVKSFWVGSRLLAISIWNDDETKALVNCFWRRHVVEQKGPRY